MQRIYNSHPFAAGRRYGSLPEHSQKPPVFSARRQAFHIALSDHVQTELPSLRAALSDANFDTFGLAFITLVRASTGENWNGIM